MIPTVPPARSTWVVAAAVLVCVTAAVGAQRRFFGGFGREPDIHNVPYTGQFTFVRVKYTPAPDGYWAGGRPSWVHGFPIAEWNLMKIMNEVSYLNPRSEETNALTLDDPELCKFPIAYIIEVGWWTLTDREADGLRLYLQKGGFVIVDDFKMPGWRGLPGGGWEPFEANMKRVLPAARFVDLEVTHPIFHTFFEINSLDNFPQAYNSGHPIFRGLFEDNDPTRRLQMIVNYNTDISQYWEWSGRGLRPIDDTNEAYKLGVNYIIYGLTH
jgi:hypothetical protein